MSGAGTPSLRAVIFDVDGTLAETERDGHRPAFNEAFRLHGLPYEWSVDEYGDLLSTTGGARRLARYLASRGHGEGVDAMAESLHRTKTELVRLWVERGEDVAARPGARELISDLRETGISVGVASTGRDDWVRPLLDRLFGPGTFEVVITGDDVARLKPDPEAYLVALSRLGVTSDQALAVEDSPPGLAAARAAGIACVVVASQYNRAAQFPGALAVVHSYLASTGGGDGVLGEGVTAAALTRLHSTVGRGAPKP